MAIDYSSIQAQASAGINFFLGGKSTPYKLITPGGLSIVNGEEVMSPETSQDVLGVIRDVTSRDIDGESILAGDKKGIFDHKVAFSKGMLIDIDGERFTVVDPRVIKPGDAVVAYRPILRRVSVYG